MKKYKFPKRGSINSDHLIELESLLNSEKNVDSVTKIPNQIKAFHCGEILLKHINKNNLQGGFSIIQVMNLHQSYIYGDFQNLNVWKKIIEIIDSCLSPQGYLAIVNLGIVIHSWGNNIEKDFKLTLKQIREKLLLLETGSIFLETSINLPITTDIGYLIYPNDCGQQESFFPVTCFTAMTISDVYCVDKKSYLSRYHHSLAKKAELKIKTEKKLILSILKNDIKLFIQPVFDLLTNQIIGIESSFRCMNSAFSGRENSEYVSVIENSKYILDFTKYSFNNLVDFIHKNKCLLSKDLKIYFKIPEAVFKWDNFTLINMIEKAIRNIPELPTFLVIEISESAYFVKTISNEIRCTLIKIKRLKIQILINNFGRGYGALKLLTSNIPDIIKLDRKLTRDICNQRLDSTFMKSLIYAAKLSKFIIIAKGVETKKQKMLLLHYGIRFGQGNNLSKPLSEKDFLKYISEFKRL